ncbi:glycosyltransferase [Terrimicrobium sacchariphilum]|uniref:Glycosyltransferase n=1 Tax=Terrimicrobium sacchariphilum TaxID=690879 RepID=A0A146GFG3_TERSA|nr:glycosyltransferase [Terrimicrobium sacchariphilum]GAT35357.1 glycosyltransferase [Terrimicrobium sacchariphilum]
MNLVLAHDYLIQMGGAERVVATMHRRFPSAPIYTSAVSRKTLWADFADADIRTTWLQGMPGIEHHTHFKKYLPLYPLAFRSITPPDATHAWISSSTFAKYMRFSPGTRTVCYIHNPTRFLWQTDEYLDHEVRHSLLNRLVRAFLPPLRRLDQTAARRMDVLVANSRNVQERIRQFYGRESEVIPPPVQTDRFSVCPENDDSYLIVSRLLGYKNIDIAVRAFTQSGRRLIILGEGPYRADLEKMAGPSIEFLGRRSDDEVRDHFQRCRAFLFPGHEDFGITPVEAMACGKPVIALKKGGALETVVEGLSGVFFDEAKPESLARAVERLESTSWNAEAIRAHAEQFSEAAFLRRMERVLFP